jgi:hypothetical protein
MRDESLRTRTTTIRFLFGFQRTGGFGQECVPLVITMLCNHHPEKVSPGPSLLTHAYILETGTNAAYSDNGRYLADLFMDLLTIVTKLFLL